MNGFERYTKKTRRQVFLEEMSQVVPWRELCALIEPHYPKPGNGRPPVGVERMLRIYFLQQWFNLSDPAVEEARLAGDAAVRGDRFGLRAGTGRNHGVQVSAFAGRTSTWGKDSGHGQSALASPGSTHHHRHDRGRNHPARAHVDQEPRAAARSGDAPDQERQAVVLRDESPCRSGQQDQDHPYGGSHAMPDINNLSF
jgi:hypothetical protein